ncbi:MAG TPA: hypothetical protein VD903_08645 [Pseudonocardia sp.]|nr:hypothetical protein [Pseudonocardia sp.]
MRGQGNGSAGRHREIATRLALEYAGVLSPGAVAAEVRAAERDLLGQVPAGSLDELLHRLAGQRLAERVGAGP